MFDLVDAYDYEDPESKFERPPGVIVLKRVGSNARKYATQRFIIISAHIKPEAGAKDMVTEDEIEALKQVYDEARERKARKSLTLMRNLRIIFFRFRQWQNHGLSDVSLVDLVYLLNEIIHFMSIIQMKRMLTTCSHNENIKWL